MGKSKAKLTLRALTQKGVKKFEKLLVNGRDGLEVSDIENEINIINENEDNVTILDENVYVDTKQELKTRNDIATYFAGLLKTAKLNAGPFSKNRHVYSWLAMIFLTKICRIKDKKLIIRTEIPRYILSDSQRDFYRHLIAFPVWVLNMYGQKARIFLYQDAYIMPDVVETVASRTDLITSPGVINVIDKLYWDTKNNTNKVGFTNREPDHSPSPGTLRALDLILSQMACTCDLRSISPAKIQAMLPPEFDKFKN